jgi:hypothetical protein
VRCEDCGFEQCRCDDDAFDVIDHERNDEGLWLEESSFGGAA